MGKGSFCKGIIRKQERIIERKERKE